MSLTLHKKAFSELTTGELYELLRIRNEVFVVEQDCVYQDLDYDDQPAIHLWLTEGDKIVAREFFGATQIDLEAQEYAKGFYEQVGFRQSSEPFILDGILHIRMTWNPEGDAGYCRSPRKEQARL